MVVKQWQIDMEVGTHGTASPLYGRQSSGIVPGAGARQTPSADKTSSRRVGDASVQQAEQPAKTPERTRAEPFDPVDQIAHGLQTDIGYKAKEYADVYQDALDFITRQKTQEKIQKEKELSEPYRALAGPDRFKDTESQINWSSFLRPEKTRDMTPEYGTLPVERISTDRFLRPEKEREMSPPYGTLPVDRIVDWFTKPNKPVRAESDPYQGLREMQAKLGRHGENLLHKPLQKTPYDMQDTQRIQQDIAQRDPYTREQMFSKGREVMPDIESHNEKAAETTILDALSKLKDTNKEIYENVARIIKDPDYARDPYLTHMVPLRGQIGANTGASLIEFNPQLGLIKTQGHSEGHPAHDYISPGAHGPIGPILNAPTNEIVIMHANDPTSTRGQYTLTYSLDYNQFHNYVHVNNDNVLTRPGDIVRAGEPLTNMGYTGRYIGVDGHFRDGVHVTPQSSGHKTPKPTGDNITPPNYLLHFEVIRVQ